MISDQLTKEKDENETHIVNLNLTNLNPSDKTLLFHDMSFPHEKFELESTNIKSSSYNPGANKLTYKGNLIPLKIDLLQKLNPANIIKPIQEKINQVKESLTHPNSPAFGGIKFWSPEQIWEKIHGAGQNFFTGE